MIAYIFKSTLSLIILFGLYWFLLRKEKLFSFNRYFLLLSVVFSLVVPFISIPVTFQVTPQLKDIIPAYNKFVPEISAADNNPVYMNLNQPYVEKQPSVINISGILLAAYISGVILFLIRFLRNISIIIRRAKSSEKTSFKGYRIVLTTDKTEPCCFFYSIFLNKDDYLNSRIDKELLYHELEHAKQSHTIDIILIELFKIFYWFNPVYILYDQAIRINHEYLADKGVISDKSDIKNYAYKLLKIITCRGNMSLTSGSNHSFTKMRLIMLMKPGSGSFIYGIRIAVTICMGIVLFLFLSFKKSYETPSDQYVTEAGTEMTQGTVRGIVMTKDDIPLKEANIVCVSPKKTPSGVTTGSDGRFAINNVQADDSLVIGCFGYEKQTIKPDFTSEMIIKMIKEPNFPEIKEVLFRNADFTPARALAAINGKIIDFNGSLRVSPGEIKSFTILKDEEAISKYGDKGKDGVLEIVLYGKQSGSAIKKQSDKVASDSSKYITLLGVNHGDNKGELIDIPVSNLQSVYIWTYHDTPRKDGKELRSIGIMTRDFFRVKGSVVNKNGKPLSGVSISATDNPVKEISDKDGHFVMKDVRENGLLEFSLPGYKPYYLVTSTAVFTTELTIPLEKDNIPEKDVYLTAETMPQYPGGDAELKKFIATNVNYPKAALEQKAKGTVMVRFVVNTKGKIEDVQILHGVHPAIDTEVLRIMGKLERFIPGSQGGKAVNVYYTLPITFSY